MAFFNISFFKSKLAIFAAKRAQERKDRFIKSIFFFHLKRNTSTFTRPGDWYWTHACGQRWHKSQLVKKSTGFLTFWTKIRTLTKNGDFLQFDQKSRLWQKMGTFCILTKNPDFDKKSGLFLLSALNAYWLKISTFRILIKNRDFDQKKKKRIFDILIK